jgi:hypothetical protein
MRRQGRAALNLMFGQVYRNDSLAKLCRFQRVRRNENRPFAQPTSGVCDEISNRPTLVIEVEVLDCADFSVQGTQLVTIHIFSFSQHTHLPLAVITPSVKQEESKTRQKDMLVLNK